KPHEIGIVNVFFERAAEKRFGGEHILIPDMENSLPNNCPNFGTAFPSQTDVSRNGFFSRNDPPVHVRSLHDLHHEGTGIEVDFESLLALNQARLRKQE